MSEEYKRRQCFPLRLAPSMRRQADDLADREGISLNHFISLAIAEKITRMEQPLAAVVDQSRLRKESPLFARPATPRHN
jgi:hypothetical protein